ncbi:MAG: hypothetical protein ABFS08_09220 [Pseudomonadota bacterium]
MGMRILYLLFLLLLQQPATASSLSEVEALLGEDKAPDGVVFEILEDAQGLRWAIPQIINYSTQLRTRFKALPIAVMSHGREEFALQRHRQSEFPEVHLAVQSLNRKQGILVHVCATHASWYQVNPEDFPDYVDVAPSGPAQIQAYEELGYQPIVISRDPEGTEAP